jgi:hypothetical protein
MLLPSGYANERHREWSRPDPSQSAQQSSTWAWDDLDDIFLFPMSPPKSHRTSYSQKGSVSEAGTIRHSQRGARNETTESLLEPTRAPSETTIGYTATFLGDKAPSSQPIPIKPLRGREARKLLRKIPQLDATKDQEGREEDDLSWDARWRFEQRYLEPGHITCSRRQGRCGCGCCH